MNVAEVRADLIAEQQALDAVVEGLESEHWSLPSRSEGWTVADQIGHLAYFDGTAALAITDPDRFRLLVDELMSTLGTGTDPTLDEYRTMNPPELLGAWRSNRRVLADASAALADDDRVIWYGPSMGSKSFLTARLMECWAHGQHVIDALADAGIERHRPATDRLRHIAQLGFITRGWTYVNRGLAVPASPVRVELSAPDGGTWTYGPDDADQIVRGSAEDFCLVVTQCRNVASTGLAVDGDDAVEWMSMAQAFAGGPTDAPD